jgi:hypothetical protein
MEASGGQAGRKARLINWLLWWRVDPAELRAGSLFAARGFGVFLAALAAAMTAFVAYHAMPYELSLSVNAGVTLSCLVLLAFALGWVALGGLLLRGHRAAIPGLLALCTAQALSVGIMLLTAASSYWKYDYIHLPTIGTAFLSLLMWAVYMHGFTLAFRAGRSREGMA